MAFGLGRLRLSPFAFWALTPLELAALIGRPPQDKPDLAALMAAFPDQRVSNIKETIHGQ